MITVSRPVDSDSTGSPAASKTCTASPVSETGSSKVKVTTSGVGLEHRPLGRVGARPGSRGRTPAPPSHRPPGSAGWRGRRAGAPARRSRTGQAASGGRATAGAAPRRRRAARRRRRPGRRSRGRCPSRRRSPAADVGRPAGSRPPSPRLPRPSPRRCRVVVPSSPASVTTNDGRRATRGRPRTGPSAGIWVQAVSPCSQVWIVGNARVEPPSASSGICSESSKVSRYPSGSGVFAV